MKCHVHAHQSSCKQVLTAAYLNKLLGQVIVCSILQLINLCFPLSSQSFKCILILPLHCASGNIKGIIIIYYLIRSKLSFSYNFNYESKIYVVVFQGTSLASFQIDFFSFFHPITIKHNCYWQARLLFTNSQSMLQKRIHVHINQTLGNWIIQTYNKIINGAYLKVLLVAETNIQNSS